MKLYNAFNLFVCVALLAFTSSVFAADECKPQAHQLELAEGFLWVLKGRTDVTKQEYKQTYDLYRRIKADYDQCVKDS